jgi:hypothetical protein
MARSKSSVAPCWVVTGICVLLIVPIPALIVGFILTRDWLFVLACAVLTPLAWCALGALSGHHPILRCFSLKVLGGHIVTSFGRNDPNDDC